MKQTVKILNEKEKAANKRSACWMQVNACLNGKDMVKYRTFSEQHKRVGFCSFLMIYKLPAFPQIYFGIILSKQVFYGKKKETETGINKKSF